MPGKLRIVVLLSGGGTTLENLFAHIDEQQLPAEIDLVISSRQDAYGLVRAENHGVDTAVVASKEFWCAEESRMDWAAMSEELSRLILAREPDLVCFAGFMCMYLLPKELDGKVINIHPALIPSFCGKGMYGHHVHEAVIEAGVKVTGCTVHFVNNEYDAGPIILQRTCPVYDTDTADILAERVMGEERIAYPEAVRLFAEGRLSIVKGRVRIEP